MKILSIAGRELRSLFLSPLAWVVMAVVQVVLGWIFLVQLEFFMQVQPRLASIPGAPGLTELVAARLISTAGFVLLLVVPLLTMRLISEERRARTLPLLLSAPLSMTEIVLGKYLGILGFFACMLLLIALMPLTLLSGGTLDFGLLAAALLGLALLVASFAAAGLFMSTLTAQPAVAAVSTFGLLLLLWIMDIAGSSGSNEASSLFSHLSLLTHFDAFLRGVFDTKDVAYFLIFIATFIALSIRRLDAYRLQH